MSNHRALVGAACLAMFMASRSETSPPTTGVILSATWTPGTGPPTPIVDGAEVEFDTALSRGVVTLVAEYPGTVSDPTIAFALQYGPGRFAEAGRDRYFRLDAGLIESVSTGPSTVVTAVIPMVSFPTLMPDSLGDNGQTLLVWIGQASDTSARRY